MSHKIELQIIVKDATIPKKDFFKKCAQTTLNKFSGDFELTIRVVDEPEMTNLNEQYRQKKGPTNVLAFPSDLPEELNLPLLGDIVICAPIIAKEAEEQHKEIQAHWAHMIVHGTLHLLGFDHMDDAEADEMEAEEIIILEELGFSNPYLEM